MNVIQRAELEQAMAQLRAAAKSMRALAPMASLKASAIAREVELKIQQLESGLL